MGSESKFALVSMIRNERDILPVWINLNLQLFDYIYIADHLSNDGTYEYLEEISRRDNRLKLLTYKALSYDQDLVLTALMREVSQNTDAEWIFFLDSDEFLPYSSRDQLESSMLIESYDVLFFNWNNCFSSAPLIINTSFPGFRSRQLSKFGKIAIRSNIARDERYTIPKGAHYLQHSELGRLDGFPIGAIYHFPVRSAEQIWRKVLTGCQSYLNDPKYGGKQGRHWFQLLEYLAEASASWTAVPSFVHRYGDGPPNADLDKAWLGFEAFEFDLSESVRVDEREVRLAREDVERSLSFTIHHVYNDRELYSMLKDVASKHPLPLGTIRVEAGEIAHFLDYGTKSFAPLPDLSAEGLDLSQLVNAVQAMFWPIEQPLPSAWGEHIPTLFALFVLLRPRRYVELGVHRGTSFLAACQAVRFSGMDCHCIGVDAWIGERHAGRSDDTVFQDFREKLSGYADFAGYIRSDFGDAVRQFEPQSIDLLHIDGCHSVDMVRRDFEQWAGKLSRRGVILFHDTNEFGSDFGVWRFWRTVRATYPSIELRHCHGLGILVVGDQSPLAPGQSEIAKILLSEERFELLQSLLGGIGQLSWSNATALTRPTESQVASVNRELTSVKRNLDRTQQRLNELTVERDELRARPNPGDEAVSNLLRQQTLEKALSHRDKRLTRLRVKKEKLAAAKRKMIRRIRHLVAKTTDAGTRKLLQRTLAVVRVRAAKKPNQAPKTPLNTDTVGDASHYEAGSAISRKRVPSRSRRRENR